MLRGVTFILLCLTLIGCGAPSATPQPMQPAAPWGAMIAVELTGFAPLAKLDLDGTGEVLLVGVLQDATGQIVICSDDNARSPDSTNPPVHIPLDVVYNEPIGLKCNGAGRLQTDGRVALTFVAFEIDDLGIITDVVDVVLDALAIAALAEPTPIGEVPPLIMSLINRGLASYDFFKMVDIMDVYYKRVGHNEDYSYSGDVASNEGFRLHYHTSPVLNEDSSVPQAPTVPPRSPSDLIALLKTFLPYYYFVCQRNDGQQSCRERGGLNIRDTPCALNDKKKEQGGNIVGIARNGTYVHRIREEFVQSDCPTDGVEFWMYVRTEDGHEGYMSASLTYLNPDFLRE